MHPEPRSRIRPRPGFSLLELTAAMTLLAIVLAIVTGLLLSESRLARSAGAAAEAAGAIRVATGVTSAELRAIEPLADLNAIAADSVLLRAFRGWGVVCDTAGPFVRYRGLRDPDPTKDSVLIVSATLARAMDLASAAKAAGAPATCALLPGETPWRLTTAGAFAAGDIVALFETGAYSLAGGAFRYRRGGGGRQPLTADVFSMDSSTFRLLPPTAAPAPALPRPPALELHLAPDTARRPAARFPPRRVRVPFLDVRRDDGEET